MAEPSRKPSFRQYNVKPFCGGCSRKLRATEPLWFRGLPKPCAVFGLCCWKQGAVA